jgi:hypothetical protein
MKNPNQSTTGNAKAWGIGSLAGSLFFPLLSLVAGVISLVKGRNSKDKTHFPFALGGVIISSLNLIARVLFFGAIIMSLILTAGHGGGSNKPAYTNSTPNPECNTELFYSESGFVACQVIGMDELSAIEYIDSLGFSSRVVERDGESFIVTADYRPDRINLAVRGNQVFNTTLG